MLEAVVLSFGCYLRVVLQGVTSQFANGNIYEACDNHRMIVTSYGRIWKLLLRSVSSLFRNLLMCTLIWLCPP